MSGEIREYTKLQHVARDEALYRLRNAAQDGSTDTVIIFHFGAASSKFGESVATYGTTVYIEKL
ncbi:heavy metal-binding domain-containing protein [Weissella muntiaci]|uniref:Heavy metal-binding domain-containing protein n=1 Tax=Weissella muntiaci TaxID=2508881 RepID=A0A6C2C8Q1_9LACO|nr:heavy metal-binding domain-containing protein [Weissella muntiaci]